MLEHGWKDHLDFRCHAACMYVHVHLTTLVGWGLENLDGWSKSLKCQSRGAGSKQFQTPKEQSKKFEHVIKKKKKKKGILTRSLQKVSQRRGQRKVKRCIT